jgi:hypothetical protein
MLKSGFTLEHSNACPASCEQLTDRLYGHSKDCHYALGVEWTSAQSKYRGLAAMKSSWQKNTGNLSCRWSEVGQRVQYASGWIHETSVVQSGHLPPVPDFASHSPFGSGEWFAPWRLRWNTAALRRIDGS